MKERMPKSVSYQCHAYTHTNESTSEETQDKTPQGEVEVVMIMACMWNSKRTLLGKEAKRAATCEK